jgi:ferrochelatase
VSAADARVGVLVMAHGTPRSLDDLEAFYTKIRRGNPPTADLLSRLERRYKAIGGTSPLNERTEAQTEGIASALQRVAPGRYVVAAGSRFSTPSIEDAVAELGRAGVGRAVGLVLTPQSSVASVGEYARRANEAVAALESDQGGPFPIEVIDHWHDEPELARLLAERVEAATKTLGRDQRDSTTVLFSAHSIPARLVEAGDHYPVQVAETASAVAAAGGLKHCAIAFQSAGRTEERWLGPDLFEVIASLPDQGTTAVVVCPVGFVSDHLEVLYDIDIEARAVADAHKLAFARTASLDDDPRFCTMLAGVVTRAAGHSGV